MAKKRFPPTTIGSAASSTATASTEKDLLSSISGSQVKPDEEEEYLPTSSSYFPSLTTIIDEEVNESPQKKKVHSSSDKSSLPSNKRERKKTSSTRKRSTRSGKQKERRKSSTISFSPSPSPSKIERKTKKILGKEDDGEHEKQKEVKKEGGTTSGLPAGAHPTSSAFAKRTSRSKQRGKQLSKGGKEPSSPSPPSLQEEKKDFNNMIQKSKRSKSPSRRSGKERGKSASSPPSSPRRRLSKGNALVVALREGGEGIDGLPSQSSLREDKEKEEEKRVVQLEESRPVSVRHMHFTEQQQQNKKNKNKKTASLLPRHFDEDRSEIGGTLFSGKGTHVTIRSAKMISSRSSSLTLSKRSSSGERKRSRITITTTTTTGLPSSSSSSTSTTLKVDPPALSLSDGEVHQNAKKEESEASPRPHKNNSKNKNKKSTSKGRSTSRGSRKENKVTKGGSPLKINASLLAKSRTSGSRSSSKEKEHHGKKGSTSKKRIKAIQGSPAKRLSKEPSRIRITGKGAAAAATTSIPTPSSFSFPSSLHHTSDVGIKSRTENASSFSGISAVPSLPPSIPSVAAAALSLKDNHHQRSHGEVEEVGVVAASSSSGMRRMTISSTLSDLESDGAGGVAFLPPTPTAAPLLYPPSEGPHPQQQQHPSLSSFSSSPFSSGSRLGASFLPSSYFFGERMEEIFLLSICACKASYAVPSIYYNSTTARVEPNPYYRRHIAAKRIALQGVVPHVLRPVFTPSPISSHDNGNPPPHYYYHHHHPNDDYSLLSSPLDHLTPREGLLVLEKALLLLFTSLFASFPLGDHHHHHSPLPPPLPPPLSLSSNSSNNPNTYTTPWTSSLAAGAAAASSFSITTKAAATALAEAAVSSLAGGSNSPPVPSPGRASSPPATPTRTLASPYRHDLHAAVQSVLEEQEGMGSPVVCHRHVHSALPWISALQSCLAHRTASPFLIATLGHVLCGGGGGLTYRTITEYLAILQQRIRIEAAPMNQKSSSRRSPAENYSLEVSAECVKDLAAALEAVQVGYNAVQVPPPPPLSSSVTAFSTPRTSWCAASASLLCQGFYRLLRVVLQLSSLDGFLWRCASERRGAEKMGMGMMGGGEEGVTAAGALGILPPQLSSRVTQFDPATGRLTLTRATTSTPWGLELNQAGELVSLHYHTCHSTPAGHQLFLALQQQGSLPRVGGTKSSSTSSSSLLPSGWYVVGVEERRIPLPLPPSLSSLTATPSSLGEREEREGKGKGREKAQVEEKRRIAGLLEEWDEKMNGRHKKLLSALHKASTPPPPPSEVEGGHGRRGRRSSGRTQKTKQNWLGKTLHLQLALPPSAAAASSSSSTSFIPPFLARPPSSGAAVFRSTPEVVSHPGPREVGCIPLCDEAGRRWAGGGGGAIQMPRRVLLLLERSSTSVPWGISLETPLPPSSPSAVDGGGGVATGSSLHTFFPATTPGGTPSFLDANTPTTSSSSVGVAKRNSAPKNQKKTTGEDRGGEERHALAGPAFSPRLLTIASCTPTSMNGGSSSTPPPHKTLKKRRYGSRPPPVLLSPTTQAWLVRCRGELWVRGLNGRPTWNTETGEAHILYGGGGGSSLLGGGPDFIPTSTSATSSSSSSSHWRQNISHLPSYHGGMSTSLYGLPIALWGGSRNTPLTGGGGGGGGAPLTSRMALHQLLSNSFALALELEYVPLRSPPPPPPATNSGGGGSHPPPFSSLHPIGGPGDGGAGLGRGDWSGGLWRMEHNSAPPLPSGEKILSPPPPPRTDSSSTIATRSIPHATTPSTATTATTPTLADGNKLSRVKVGEEDEEIKKEEKGGKEKSMSRDAEEKRRDGIEKDKVTSSLNEKPYRSKTPKQMKEKKGEEAGTTEESSSSAASLPKALEYQEELGLPEEVAIPNTHRTIPSTTTAVGGAGGAKNAAAKTRSSSTSSKSSKSTSKGRGEGKTEKEKKKVKKEKETGVLDVTAALSDDLSLEELVEKEQEEAKQEALEAEAKARQRAFFSSLDVAATIKTTKQSRTGRVEEEGSSSINNKASPTIVPVPSAKKKIKIAMAAAQAASLSKEKEIKEGTPFPLKKEESKTLEKDKEEEKKVMKKKKGEKIVAIVAKRKEEIMEEKAKAGLEEPAASTFTEKSKKKLETEAKESDEKLEQRGAGSDDNKNQNMNKKGNPNTSLSTCSSTSSSSDDVQLQKRSQTSELSIPSSSSSSALEEAVRLVAKDWAKEEKSATIGSKSSKKMPSTEMVPSSPDTTATRTTTPAPASSGRRGVSLVDLVDAPALAFDNKVVMETFNGTEAAFQRPSANIPWNINLTLKGDDMLLTRLPPYSLSSTTTTTSTSSSSLFPSSSSKKQQRGGGEIGLSPHPFVEYLGASPDGSVRVKVQEINGEDVTLMSKRQKEQVLQTIRSAMNVRFALRKIVK